MTYKKILADHGLKFRYDDPKKKSWAFKCHEDQNGFEAMISVTRKKGKFSIQTLGRGSWKKYFDREARVLEASLKVFGEVSVSL